MKKYKEKRYESEQKFVTKCIFKGLSIAQIAQKMYCSQSTVSNRMSEIFKQYNVKNRFEFIIAVFGEIIKKNNLKTERKDIKILNLEEELQDLKKIIIELIKNKNQEKEYKKTLIKVSKYFKIY